MSLQGLESNSTSSMKHFLIILSTVGLLGSNVVVIKPALICIFFSTCAGICVNFIMYHLNRRCCIPP